MQKLKLAYFGSPSFSATLLEKIINDKNLPVEVKLVVTQPDMPVGRKQILTPTPVKTIAQQYHLPVVETLHVTRFALHKIDLFIVYAYGEILPKELLNLPKHGFWNIHPSLLPKYRGASPITYPLILGDKKTGVSLMLMDKKMDHGPILAQEEMEILPNDKRFDLENKLTNLAFNIFKKQILSLTNNPLSPLPLTAQDHSLATYTTILKKSDGFIPLPNLKKMLQNEKILTKELPQFIQEYISKYSNDQLKPTRLAAKRVENWKLLALKNEGKIENSSKLLFNLFRGLSPWPGLWTLLPNGKRLKITKLTMKQFNNLTINSVQLESKKEVDFNTFNKAYRIFETLP